MVTQVGEGPAGALVDRAAAVVTAAAGIGVVWLLAGVDPDPRGHGTHEQLGMMPCGWPGTIGLPCPTCGVTTAACHLVHFSPVRALVTQPFGALLAAAGLLMTIYALLCLARKRSFIYGLARLPYGSILLWTLVLFMASWLYKYLTFA